ncbi:MAG TPA: carboxymuconolactone decarboxylase family protein [Edaphobacter sp.]
MTIAEATEARMEFADFERIAPEARAALSALSKAVGDSGLDKGLTELIKIRASQINGCAFCVQFHLNLARKLRVSQTKLDLMAVWRDAGVFTKREMAALAWTEVLTEIGTEGVGDEAYAAVKVEFGESELIFLTAAIASINAWNRIAMAYRFTPPIAQEGD